MTWPLGGNATVNGLKGETGLGPSQEAIYLIAFFLFAFPSICVYTFVFFKSIFQSFIHLCIHVFIYLLIYSFIYLPIYSIIYHSVNLCIHVFTLIQFQFVDLLLFLASSLN